MSVQTKKSCFFLFSKKSRKYKEALTSAVAELDILKAEDSVNKSRIAGLEVQISSLKADLEEEHQRWRDAQNNYERQVILQFDTLQELTKTSQALNLLQNEISELRKLVDTEKSANGVVGGDGPSTSMTTVDVQIETVGLHQLKEEIERLKEEAKANKDHMLQYKEALTSAVAELDILKAEDSVKRSRIAGLEVQISSLRADLEEEHQRWREAQNNHERQGVVGGDGPSTSMTTLMQASWDVGSSVPRCQVAGCPADLTIEKAYCRQRKICDKHAKASAVSIEHRYCQKCNRFHLLSEFDGVKRSCRRALDMHNKRRRKS